MASLEEDRVKIETELFSFDIASDKIQAYIWGLLQGRDDISKQVADLETEKLRLNEHIEMFEGVWMLAQIVSRWHDPSNHLHDYCAINTETGERKCPCGKAYVARTGEIEHNNHPIQK